MDLLSPKTGNDEFGNGKRYYYTPNSFSDALLTVLAAAMNADGRVTKSELSLVKQILISQFGEEEAKTQLLKLRDMLKTNLDVRAAAMQIGSMVSYADKLKICEILCQIAEADGIITDSEVQTVVNIAYYMGLSRQDVVNISERLHPNGRERGNYSYEGSNSYDSNAPSLKSAYETLGIKEDATNEELKNAYRKLVKKYHPDRYANESADAQAEAETKFKEVQAAYDKIKAARGL